MHAADPEEDGVGTGGSWPAGVINRYSAWSIGEQRRRCAAVATGAGNIAMLPAWSDGVSEGDFRQQCL
jgi:hypothetical protein